MSVFLTQAEADILLSMEKHRADDERRRLPDTGGGLTVPLISVDRAELFHLDIRRGRMNLAKGTMQNRARTTAVLARIDVGGAPHRNPDGEEPRAPTFIYIEKDTVIVGRFQLSVEEFADPSDHWQTLLDFYAFLQRDAAAGIRTGALHMSEIDLLIDGYWRWLRTGLPSGN